MNRSLHGRGASRKRVPPMNRETSWAIRHQRRLSRVLMSERWEELLRRLAERSRPQ